MVCPVYDAGTFCYTPDMKVNQIYIHYMTPQNLQTHMLRTTSLAKVLLEFWKGVELDKNAIIQACLFHDIAKPMKFDLAKQAQYSTSEEDINKLAQLQNRIKNNYGEVEHHATVMICKEIGLSDAAINFVDNLEWSYIPRLLEANDISSLIPIYCDMRIGPKGVLPLQERLREIKERVGGDDYEDNVRNGKLLEPKITENVAIDVNAISTDQLDANFDSLLNFEIAK